MQILKSREMVHYQSYHDHKMKSNSRMPDAIVVECGNSGYYYKRAITKLLCLILLLLLLSFCSFILAPKLFITFSDLQYYSFGGQSEGLVADSHVNAPLCSIISNGTMSCDRSSFRSDICFMKGDVRTHSASSSIFLYTSRNTNGCLDYFEEGNEDEQEEFQHEKIKPYTRKWETSIMDIIGELDLIFKTRENVENPNHCDVYHDVPAIFFSTGGYTGNVYHDFNDGLLPLYITSQHLNRKVVFVILEYHTWWIRKYGDILYLLSDYPAIDFSGDNKTTHCFSEAIVGLRIHGELTVDSSLMVGNKSIKDFRNILNRAYRPRINGLNQDEEQELELKSKEKLSLESGKGGKKPKLVIVSRAGWRKITNADPLVKMAEKIGFRVKLLRPCRTTELATIYQALHSSDAMMGVHGAAMTHFLFLKPGSVFIQVIPLGTEWPAETYYGEPARKLGLKYIGYKILPKESSLYDKYDKNDPVLRDPRNVTKKGWQFTKKIYLDGQNVRLDLKRFRKRLTQAYGYSILRRTGAFIHNHTYS